MTIEELGKQIVDASFQVHSALGPGLLESQIELPVTYKNHQIPVGYRLDILVEKQIIIELKAVDLLRPIHKAQLLTYLKLTGHTLGTSSTSTSLSSKMASVA